MNDERHPEDDLDLRASEASDAARRGVVAAGLPEQVRHRADQFDRVRRALIDDSDAPSAEHYEQMVARALAAAAEQPDAAPQSRREAGVVSLGARRRRRLEWLGATAAGVVVIAGAGWFALRSADPASEVATESRADAVSGGSSSVPDEAVGESEAAESEPSTTVQTPAGADSVVPPEALADSAGEDLPEPSIPVATTGEEGAAATDSGGDPVPAPQRSAAVEGSPWQALGRWLREAVVEWWISR